MRIFSCSRKQHHQIKASWHGLQLAGWCHKQLVCYITDACAHNHTHTMFTLTTYIVSGNQSCVYVTQSIVIFCPCMLMQKDSNIIQLCTACTCLVPWFTDHAPVWKPVLNFKGQSKWDWTGWPTSFLLCHVHGYTVKPVYSGHLGTSLKCPDYQGVLIFQVSLHVFWDHYQVSWLWRCPYFQVSWLTGFTVVNWMYAFFYYGFDLCSYHSYNNQWHVK